MIQHCRRRHEAGRSDREESARYWNQRGV